MKKIDDMDILSRFTIEFCEIVEKHCPYVIVSGFLPISTGRSRGTEDIDIIVPKLSFEEFRKLHDELSEKFSLINLEGLDLKEIYEDYLLDSNIRYAYKDRIIPNMEFKFAKNAVDMDNLENRKKIPITGLDIYFAPIECAIAFKESYLGSEKDLEDANHLRKVFEDDIDENEVKRYEEMLRKV